VPCLRKGRAWRVGGESGGGEGARGGGAAGGRRQEGGAGPPAPVLKSLQERPVVGPVGWRRPRHAPAPPPPSLSLNLQEPRRTLVPKASARDLVPLVFLSGGLSEGGGRVGKWGAPAE